MLPKCVPFLPKESGWCGLNVYFWYPASWTQMMQSFSYIPCDALCFLCLYAVFGILASSASCEEDLLQKLQLLGVSVWSIGLWGWSHPIFPWLWHKGQVASVDQRGVATYEVNVGFCWTSERSNGHVDLFGSFWAQEPVANFKCAQGSTKMLGKFFLSFAGHSISERLQTVMKHFIYSILRIS